MDSIDALAQAIREFEGGVVIVSHDFRKPIYCRNGTADLNYPNDTYNRTHIPGRRRIVGGCG